MEILEEQVEAYWYQDSSEGDIQFSTPYRPQRHTYQDRFEWRYIHYEENGQFFFTPGPLVEREAVDTVQPRRAP